MKTLEKNLTARRILDIKLDCEESLDRLKQPTGGWVRAIRQSLGMTTAQLARRLGVSQPAIISMERSESQGHIQIDTLKRIAESLDCRVVYAVVPNKPLEATVNARRRMLAEELLRSVEHTMTLEGQQVKDDGARERQIVGIMAKMNDSMLWDTFE